MFRQTLHHRAGLRLAIGLTAFASAAAVIGLPALSAAAAPARDVSTAAHPAATSGDGWLRLAHLSPDTAAVDVRLTALRGGSVLYELDDVAYGSVSPYSQLASGTYTVTMIRHGAKWSSRPVLSAAVKVTAGKATTVAAFGSQKHLAVRSFSDDLTAPQTGTARVRLIQASTKVRSVDVSTSTGTALADDAKEGQATDYAAVPAGNWTLDLRAKGTADSSTVDLAAGTVSTLLVLDTRHGLTLRAVLDSAATAAAPVGGVNTGGGWLATHVFAFRAPEPR